MGTVLYHNTSPMAPVCATANQSKALWRFVQRTVSGLLESPAYESVTDDSDDGDQEFQMNRRSPLPSTNKTYKSIPFPMTVTALMESLAVE